MKDKWDALGRNTQKRLHGAALVVGSIAAAWYFILTPLEEARSRTDGLILYHGSIFLVAPFGLVLGIVMLLGGARAFDALSQDGEGRKASRFGWAVFLVAIALAGAGYWWFDAQMTALGYE